ncbi:hypothetical protein GE21DRAFT_6783 [Neurospora crassa]|uniref:Uncharacterized protein n=1 Tax=Neurospora crassa (strain ATCC 24698 / 74-OR23-1A / CBS 708.71 / DSM 1257 / FGSC 987) TaxID=367110 RepID=V5IP49_NEUCR|nr:hypothetical protein NCU16904 [Neurospora crassa OR74A]ESA43110.1 hypothetical protein NCU16904 [Neurospora crassa OR74A]KHE79062.1 hypothetical protein GE21DRAFT_6783 [Neurospora crassa]|eukprot:XP_011394450.1 hypothetical protein NCU16904 [Neurospora crassa OR74A]
MPPIVRRELEGLPDQDFQNRERLMPRLVEIISNLQSRLLDVYRQSPASGHDPRPQPTTEVDLSHDKPRESGSGSGTTPSASESLDTLTPPPVPDLVVNADEFVDSLLGLDFEYNDMEITSEELQKLLDDWAQPGDMVNDEKSV